jgi:hypothetical protein
MAFQFFGEGGNDADDGAFHRLGQRQTRRCGAMADRFSQRWRIQRRQGLHPLRHPVQELRQDGAGIAAGAVDGVVADLRQQFPGMAAAPAQRAIEYAAQRGRHVVAGVPVGHRKYVDPVQPVAGRNHPAGTGDQGPAQRGGGQRFVGADGHGRESA